MSNDYSAVLFRQRGLPNEWADEEGDVQVFKWYPVPWWAFWRPKWFRRVYTPADRGARWSVEYANDLQVARDYLERAFDR